METIRKRLVTLNEPSFIKAIKDDFGYDIENIADSSEGFACQVYRATLGGETVFIRITEKARIPPLEVIGYKLFEEKGIPVPRVLAYQDHPQTIGYPTMIMTSAVGTQLSKADLSNAELESVYRDMGSLMRTMHEIKVEGFGELEAMDGKLVGSSATWADYWASHGNHYAPEIQYIKDSGLLSPEEVELLQRIYNEIRTQEFGTASLLHRDIHHVHVFVTGACITGIIDLGRLFAGDPRYDIAMAFMFQKPHEREKFIEGYGDLARDPLVTKYLLMIAAGKVAWRHKTGLSQKAVDEAVRVFRETKDFL